MSQIQKNLQINGHQLNYFLAYRAQKNIILRVREGQIFITAPHYAQDWEIEQIIYRNYSKINALQTNYEVQAKYDFYGAQPWIKIFNEEIKLVLVTEKIHPKMVNKIIYMHNYWSIEEQLRKIYPFLARIYKNWFLNRSQQWAQIMGVEYQNLALRIMPMKWGLCYPKSQNIVLNIKLIHFPPAVIDYVIVHELTHLIHPNHSANFWHTIEKFLPKYREIKTVLDRSGV